MAYRYFNSRDAPMHTLFFCTQINPKLKKSNE